MPDTANTATTSTNNTIMTTTLAYQSDCTESKAPGNKGPAVEDTDRQSTEMARDEISNTESDADGSESISRTAIFLPTQCLFCPKVSPTFDLNRSHMHKNHGLFLPLTIDNGALALAVEMETMVEYMHLIISGYHECLFCGTQRQSAHAVQQHMMERGHCRVDLNETLKGSEFRDFYESVDAEEVENESDDVSEGESSDPEKGTQAGKSPASPTKLDANTLRLSSGKILSHRSTPPPPKANRRPLTAPKPHGRHSPDLIENLMSDNTSQPSATTNDPSPALTRHERRALAHHKSALAVATSRMSRHDRAALAHLSPAEQRSVVVTQFKQQDRQAAAERKYRGKVDPRPTKARGGQRNEDCVLGDLGVAFWG